MRKNFRPGKDISFPGLKEYVLLEEIGKGGSGTVYKARQIRTGQIVALKTLVFSKDADPQEKARALARFVQEAGICAGINHPNIVRLLDKGGVQEEGLFTVFEYVSGETLKSRILQEHGLSAIQTGILMGQVLEALEAAHNSSIIHCDLKPQNIMITKNDAGELVKVLDFGISTVMTDDAYAAMNAEIAGTPTYSAPEQLRGEAVTAGSDLYSWGLILLECLCGQPVMKGHSIAAIYRQHLSEAAVPLPVFLEDHPLAMLLKKVLSKNAALRTSSAAAVLQEYRHIDFTTIKDHPQPSGLRATPLPDDDITLIRPV